MEIKEPVLRVSKMKVCWAFGENSGAKPHVVLRMGVIVFSLGTLTSGPSTEMVS